MIILPRQAPDKHRESTQTIMAFSCHSRHNGKRRRCAERASARSGERANALSPNFLVRNDHLPGQAWDKLNAKQSGVSLRHWATSASIICRRLQVVRQLPVTFVSRSGCRCSPAARGTCPLSLLLCLIRTRRGTTQLTSTATAGRGPGCRSLASQRGSVCR